MSLTKDNKTAPQEAADKIYDLSKQFQSCMLHYHRAMYSELWRNQSATPQEILDVLGTDGPLLFHAGGKLVELILTGDPTSLTPDQYLPLQEVEITPEGTVKLTPFPEPEPEEEEETEPDEEEEMEEE